MTRNYKHTHMIRTLKEAESYLYSFTRSTSEIRDASFSFDRVCEFASLAGNPQDKMQVIHIAGTSGKGSTSTYISRLLSAHGKRTGLTVSPHVTDIRERYQIDGELISEQTFIYYLNEISPWIERMKKTRYGVPSFFEISIVLAYYIFWKERVDYAVMETGLGGRLDATNIVLSRGKIAVLTRIGKDHMEILGNTIEKIATEKAMIITPESHVITIPQHKSAQRVVAAQALKTHSALDIVVPCRGNEILTKDGAIRFAFHYKECMFCHLTLATPAQYQVENATLALATFIEVSKRDGISIDESRIRSVFSTNPIQGRFENVTIQGKTVIVDGAHNGQKMSALVQSLRAAYPDQAFSFLIAFKKGKDYRGMLKHIVPVANSIVVAQFRSSLQISACEGEQPARISSLLHEVFHFRNVRIEQSPQKALETVLDNADAPIVVTGSLYFIAELYSLLIHHKNRKTN